MYTELDIINEMIMSTGARPLTAANTRHPMYMKAQVLLERVRTSVQSRGLWFNTEVRTVAQQTSGEVIVPLGCIKADPTNNRCNLTQRGSKMYDLGTGSYYIGEDVELKMFFRRNLDEMPLEAQEYVRTKAVYDFYLNEDGVDPKLSNYRNNMDKAWTMLWREHLRNRQANVFDSAHNTAARMRRGHSHMQPRPTIVR